MIRVIRLYNRSGDTNLKVLITSDENSKVVQYGDKHVHQELLEDALKKLGVKVDYFYPDGAIKLSKNRHSA